MISSAIWNLRSVPIVEFFLRPCNKRIAERIACYDEYEKAVQASVKANLAFYEYLLKNTKAEDLEWMSETIKPLKASLIADGVDLNEIEKITTKGNEDMASVTGLVATTTAFGAAYKVADDAGVVDGAKSIVKNVASNVLYDRGLSSRHAQQAADNDAMSDRRSRRQLIKDALTNGVDVPDRLLSPSPPRKERWIGGYSKETRQEIQKLANERLSDVTEVTFKLETKKNKQILKIDKQQAAEEAEIEAEIATAKAAALAVETAAKARLAKKKAQRDSERQSLSLEKNQVCIRANQAVTQSSKRLESVNNVPANSWFS